MKSKYVIDSRLTRRTFVRVGSLAGSGVLVATALEAQQTRGDRQHNEVEQDEVTPTEDLMREHGVLKRVLLVYEEAIRRLDAKQDLPPDAVREAADIIRTFIEDYHEKLEEDFLFPRFERAGSLIDLTKVLRAQHQAGRRLTEKITQLATLQTLKDGTAVVRLKDAMHGFVRMYNPHEAREDTVLFPALRQIVSTHEFGALGEDFEKKEHALFGEDGFEKLVDQVATIEKRLGFFDLSQFTPK